MIKVTVIGLGLIGGSIAKELRTQLNVEVTGIDSNPDHEKKALTLGLIHKTGKTSDDAIASADLIILAIPVNAIEKTLAGFLSEMSAHAVLIDVGSTKEKICKSVSEHPRRGRFVAAHPLAGTEFSGPEAAHKGLFVGKKNIICEKERSDADALALVEKIFESLGMETYYLTAEEHDKHLAYVSHLSHISSFTLSLTVLDMEKDESQIFNLASTGLASTVRLAKSNPATWSPIFEKNSEHLISAIDQYSAHLKSFKKALIEKDGKRLKEMMLSANRIKKILN